MALDAALAALAQGFRVNLDSSGAPNRQFVAQLVPPADSVDERGLLSVIDLVTTTQITPASLDLRWRTKDVRFLNTDITDALVAGGLPVSELLNLNIGSVTTGPTSPPGVPGLLGLISGTVPLPIDVTAPTTFPVSIDVRWRVLDEQGATVDGVRWDLGGTPPVSGTGGDIAPPLGRALSALTLVFDLLFGELTGSSLPLARRKLQAAIRLQAVGVSTGWIDLPPVDLQLPVIPVPTVALFCQNKNFGSNKLVVVPASSPLGESAVRGALETLSNTLAPLRSTFSFLGLFLDSAATVASALQSGNIAFRKADQFGNLNNIDLESGLINDTEAEDELSSMILIGPPRRRIECFNARNFGTSEGQLNLTTGTELIALIADLHSASPADNPTGSAGIPHAPSGSRFPFHSITGFGDEFSSLRFSWAP